MPKLISHVPKLSRHTRGQAFVKIGGQQIWLGRHGDPLAQEKYDRLVAQWLANGRALPPSEPPEARSLTIIEILAPYWRSVKERHQGGEVDNQKAAMKVVERLYGSLPAIEFGPNALRAVRADMVRKGWTRKQVNRQISRVRSLFRWAASHEMLPESVYNQLRTVEPLRHGEAPDRPRIKPVPRKLIRIVRNHVSRQVRALIDLQLLTAARADELLHLRARDIDRSRAVWTCSFAQHKTVHHDKERHLYFGPRAQKILKMFLPAQGKADDAYLFSPRDAEHDRHARAKIHRRPNQKPNQKKTHRVLGERYDTPSYRRAIHRALAEALPAPKGLSSEQRAAWRQQYTWGPHRLRHNAGTFLRREFGIEIARAILGHASAATTLIYAEQDERRIVQAIAKVG